MVAYKESTRLSKLGHELFVVEYHPEGAAPSAALCFHHGVAEHAGRYKQAFEQLAGAGVAVYSGDTVGHGKSGGDRIFVQKFDDLVDDFESLAEYALGDLRARAPSASAPPPLFLGGHSLGGLVAPLACLRGQTRWAGLLLCSPALDVEWTPLLRVTAAVGGLLSAVVPRARVVPAVDTTNLNRDPAKVKEYVDDPLNEVGPLPARTGNESLKAFSRLRARHGEFRLPVYAHHGTADKITSLPATRAFIAAIPSPDKTLVEVAGGYHEVMFEEGGPALVAGMAAWMAARAGQGAGASGAKM